MPKIRTEYKEKDTTKYTINLEELSIYLIH